MASTRKLPGANVDALSALARLLPMIASREPLVALLDELIRFAERLTPDMRCSILLADLSAGVLRSGAAPSLPPAYTAAIDRLPIEEGVGSCGTAAARRETVIVSDIARSPLWHGYTDLARKHGLGACWSVPLLDSRGTLIGTCAMYYAQPRAPTALEQDSIRIIGNLAAMIIQRYRDTQDLRASEERYRQLSDELKLARTELRAILDHVPARITFWDAGFVNCFANRAALAAFGVTASDIVGKHVREVIGEDSYRRAKPYMEAALRGAPQSREQGDSMPDGSQRYRKITYIPRHQDGAIVGIYVFATDITGLRQSYERIRELAHRLETVREDERQAVAQTLHEGIAQDLFAAKLGLVNLQSQAGDRTGVAQACQELAATIDKCMTATRRVANELQPIALAHLPLAAALREHARYFVERSGLRIDITEMTTLSLDGPSRVVMFRAAQEALTNVARHARASHVDIVLRADSQSITIDIVDDGVGIEDAALVKVGSLGLLGIRERLGALGGTLGIRNNTAGGSTVSLQLPLGACGGTSEDRPADPANVATMRGLH